MDNRGKSDTMKNVFAACLLLIGMLGCGLGNNDGAQVAMKMVQEYKPNARGTTIADMVAEAFPSGEWVVTKTSESLYRVLYRTTSSSEQKELLFGVAINKHHVMALNREALAFTNPR